MNRYSDEGAGMGVEISFDLKDPEVEEFISYKTIRIRDAYRLHYEQKDLPTIQQILKEQILHGYRNGESVRAVADRIMNGLVSLVEITVEQAIAIACTELVGAANYGSYVRINNSGFTKKEWFTAMDEKVRPLHRELHGKRINVGNLWVFSDENTLRYPGDDQGPDHLVIGCRCVELVVPKSHCLYGI